MIMRSSGSKTTLRILVIFSLTFLSKIIIIYADLLLLLYSSIFFWKIVPKFIIIRVHRCLKCFHRCLKCFHRCLECFQIMGFKVFLIFTDRIKTMSKALFVSFLTISITASSDSLSIILSLNVLKNFIYP